MSKAKKVETYRDKHFTAIVYEYRGMRYEVTYANGWQVCSTPAWIQHRDEQAKIDEMLDNPVSEKKSNPFSIDEVYDLMGW